METRKVDNFHKILPYFNYVGDDDFLFIQIIQRKKEIPELGCNNRLIKSYTVKTHEELIKYKSEIKTITDALNARAYIHLSPRNFLSVQSGMLSSIAEYYKSKTYKHIPKLFNTVCGKETGTRKLWLFDLDHTEHQHYYELNECFKEIEKKELRKILVDTFPTKNGWHFITNPFNVGAYTIAPEAELHKNNPTILYV